MASWTRAALAWIWKVPRSSRRAGQGDLGLDRRPAARPRRGPPSRSWPAARGPARGPRARPPRRSPPRARPGGRSGATSPWMDLVALGPERGDLRGQVPRPVGPERLQLGGPLLQLVPGRVDRLLHLAEPGLGRPGVAADGLGLSAAWKTSGRSDVGRPGGLVQQGAGSSPARPSARPPPARGSAPASRPPARFLDALSHSPSSREPLLEQLDERLRGRLLLAPRRPAP